jgi:short-subunit dehydrogenase
MESLKNKNVLVIGATGGIGSKLVPLLLSSGANVFVTGRKVDKLQSIAQQYNIDAAKTFTLDISKSNEIAQLKEAVMAQFETVDILVNAAGIGIIKTSDDLTEDDFLQTLHYNLFAPFLLVKAFLPSMKVQKKGLIINIPGILGKVPMNGAAAYSASKYGLVGMMQSIREELKRTEIRITNLFLGGADTPFWDTIDLKVQREKMVMADEAAKAIWFLCQQPASGVVSEMVLQPFNHQAI